MAPVMHDSTIRLCGTGMSSRVGIEACDFLLGVS